MKSRRTKTVLCNIFRV